MFALEEESDWRRFSLRRLARYCLDLADMFDTDRVVPVTIFLRAADRAPASLVLGTERRPYLTFDYVACKLAEMPAERWLGSSNVVARLNLPNMRSAARDLIDVYHAAVDGLLALEPDEAKRDKARPGGRDLKFIDIYAGLTDNQFRRYRQQHPEEGRIVTGVFHLADALRSGGRPQRPGMAHPLRSVNRYRCPPRQITSLNCEDGASSRTPVTAQRQRRPPSPRRPPPGTR